MKIILIDTNVALDILLQRQDYPNAKVIYLLAEKNQIACYISASAITDIFYLSEKDLGKKIAKEALKTLLLVFKPATVTDNHIFQALNLDWDDFEDSVQFIVGESLSVDYIVTRNTEDFSSGSIPAITPEQFIKTITH
ncbi:MAG: PIN domain-containing protein [Treponema sp.]|jgi:predicted nucleic acid-binding protein|nr:PIN domain-containing protein [Treponema sp.]